MIDDANSIAILTSSVCNYLIIVIQLSKTRNGEEGDFWVWQTTVPNVL